MKKLKLNLSTLLGAEILTREQLKKVVGGMYSGGGCCCAHHNGWYTCGMSRGQAKSKADEFAQTYGEGKWCCDSCNVTFDPCTN